MRTLIRVVFILFLLAGLSGQNLSKSKVDTYSKVRIFARNTEDIRALQQRGIDLDHYQGKVGEYIEVEINQNDVDQLRASGIPYSVTIANMDEYYARRPAATPAELEVSKAILQQNGVKSFTYGSMGGFYTYAQVVQKLDSMRMQYPNLITAKESIGVSWEGRTIWAVEISDNPGVAESGEAVVYFDALHHAREPEGMECLMYYMNWLLDNYGSDPEATYLVNNRRILFVPVVNPDGYVYNQTTNPNGGGSWRKNRRNNGGSYGVDLNRNYSYQWGYDNSGSSPTPSSDTYRGPDSLSEPETRAVRDFASVLRPAIGFSMHSYAGRYLNPWGYTDAPVSYEYYAEFASDFSRQNGYLYGTVMQMLQYTSNGTTRDYFHHHLNCLMWTPEVGGSGFWPSQSEIIPVAQENLLGLKYLSWVAGAFADYQSFHLVGYQNALRGGTLQFAVTVRNKGLTLNASSVNVSVQSLYPNVAPVVTSASYGSIAPRQSASNDNAPFVYTIGSGASLLDEMKFVATVTQEGVVTSVDTFSIFVGNQRVLFSDDAESGRSNWTRGGSGGQWDTTFVMAHNGTHSFADSRYGNVTNSSTYTFATTNSIDLTGTANPRLEYFARWAMESSGYYVRIQVSTNGGSTWTNLSGRYTKTVSSAPGYTGVKGTWVWEHINLNSYVGSQIKLRFSLTTGSGDKGDGFYFDNFRVVDYVNPIVVNTKVFLEGPFNAGSMSTGLNSTGYIPTSQPYNITPWSFSGTEKIGNIPSTIVDWVLVELRTGTDAATKVATRAAFLKNDGSVVDIDGTSPVGVGGLSAGNYYVVIRHRNHLPVMSGSAVALSSSSGLYDFTTAQSQAFGTDAMKPLLSGTFGMIAGDVNVNGGVGATDLASVLGAVGSVAYDINDVNMNGGVGATDLVLALSNIGYLSQVP